LLKNPPFYDQHVCCGFDDYGSFYGCLTYIIIVCYNGQIIKLGIKFLSTRFIRRYFNKKSHY